VRVWVGPTAGLKVSENSTYNEFPVQHNRETNAKYEGWNFNSGNYLFTTDTK